MLKVPQLDDLTYEQKINRAVSRIPTMTDQWTDFNSHDPGITVLQTYAWLTDMLNYYMNATGDVHIQKYLKLLGIVPQRAQASKGHVILENTREKIELSKGTVFFAGGIPFELAKDCVYTSNRFCSCVQETDGIGIDLTAFAGNDGDYAEIFGETFLEKTTAYLGFEKELHDGDSLYVTVKENKKRNKFGRDFRLCELLWEYYGESGWQPLEIQDETCGFLKSGFLKIYISEKMKAWQHPQGEFPAYYIRCSLRENDYDSMPQLGMIYVNPMEVIQKETICPKGTVVSELRIGKTNGCASQELLFDYPDLYHFSLAIEKEDEDSYEIWTMVDNLEEADYKDKVFAYDTEKRMVRFGDGLCGMVPIQNLAIYVTGLEVSKFENGNVLPGEIRGTSAKIPENCRVCNPVASSGGRAEEGIEDMMRRLEDTLFVQNRMVSEEDYQRIILSTPGLMLDLVHVIPGDVYGEMYRQDRSLNEIMVVVKPYSQEMTAKLTDAYRGMIEQHVEKFRLLNTKISIVSPVYVGIEINGKIALIQDTPFAREKVQERIKQLINYQGKERPFGNVISYGKIFTSLESMEEVKLVRELALEKNGSAAVKNDRGDIFCQEDALSYVERLNLEFC